MTTNSNGEDLTGLSPDFTESIVVAYVNQGPFMDTLNKNKMFDNIIDEIISIEIHSSIESFYRYGFIVIPDRIGFRETLSLTGNEIITVRYGNSVFSKTRPPKTIHFNIYDMEEVSLSDNNRDRYTNKAIKLHLIEAPLFLMYNHQEWSKAFGEDTGTNVNRVPINKIFESHLLNDLRITQNGFVDLDLRKMSIGMHWIIPAWKPQKTFSYLLQFAKDEYGNGDVKFYTTTDLDSNTTIINLKSIFQMIKDQDISDSYSTVNIGPMSSSLTNPGQSVIKTLNHIITYKFLSYDLTSIVSGLSGGHIHNRDYTTGRFFVQTDDYTKSLERQTFFENFGMWTDTISNWESVMYKIGTFPSDVALAYLQNKTSYQRYQLKCIANSYLNHDRNVGDKVNMEFISGASPIDLSRTKDEQMSGQWIIHEMVDYIVNNRGYSNISFIKDSFFNTVGTTSNAGGKEKLPTVTKIR